MRFQYFALVIFFGVVLSLVQALQTANAEDLFAKPEVFETPTGQSPPSHMPQYYPYGYASPPQVIVLPGAPAGAAAKPKADPNMPREVFLDTGVSESESADRKPTAEDNDEERYSHSKKKKSPRKTDDEDETHDDFVEVH